MELVERDDFLDMLRSKLAIVAGGEGQCVFISGEPGIGKTSLVKSFCKEARPTYKTYQGTCDALFTPRPLAPLYDVLWQAGSRLSKATNGLEERAELFASFFNELAASKKPVIIVFEDVHWADEATLDFIKFFARRITQVPCLFILTYRYNEIHLQHPLRNVLGQLSPDSFMRIQLPALSEDAVKTMAIAKGYDGHDVYNISGGNPFYVTEILASYSPGIPENIKDAILSVYNAQDANTRQVWELLSVVPGGFQMSFVEKMPSFYGESIERGLESAILVLNGTQIVFKHELYRRTMETSLSPLKRVGLNNKMLELFADDFERQGAIEKIVHHAKNANAYDTVVRFAPLAAKQAALVGAHIEACKLYLSAIEYYQGTDKEVLVKLYESYAYECYLTNKTKEAIIYTGKAMQIWKERNDAEQLGKSLRFLSRLWWFEGNRKNAEEFAVQAIAVLEPRPASPAKGMAYSNMSQLKMLSKEVNDCIYWGEKAISIAHELNDQEILSHALNNVGTVRMDLLNGVEEGMRMLQESLQIALTNGYDEHAARAYTNLSTFLVMLKNYPAAETALEEGIAFCEEHDLDSWTYYMLSWKARLKLETDDWPEAYRIAQELLKIDGQPAIISITVLSVMANLKLRRGDNSAIAMLEDAKAKAITTMELQRIVPVLVAFLQYEWITGNRAVDDASIDIALRLVPLSGSYFDTGELVFWLRKARKQDVQLDEIYAGYDTSTEKKAQQAAAVWKQKGCRYLQGIALSDGTEDNKREAITIMQELGATAVYEKLKMDMRSSGIKSIPRGARKTTLSNPALLTDRELDILKLLQQGLRNKEIAAQLFISAKTVDHHISSVLFKLDVNTRAKAVQEATRLSILQ